MPDFTSYSFWVRIGLEQIFALVQMAEQRGLTPPLEFDDVLEAIDGLEDDELSCLCKIAQCHKAVHDVLYASPRS